MANPQTILIVEDDALIALDIENSLLDLGFEVVSAVSVEEALPIVANRNLAFAVLDFKLQHQDTGPIAEALFATAIGLVAAIPAVIAYNKLSADAGKLIGRLEGFADEFSTILSRQLEARSH